MAVRKLLQPAIEQALGSGKLTEVAAILRLLGFLDARYHQQRVEDVRPKCLPKASLNACLEALLRHWGCAGCARLAGTGRAAMSTRLFPLEGGKSAPTTEAVLWRGAGPSQTLFSP